jgi:hypothetical protein
MAGTMGQVMSALASLSTLSFSERVAHLLERVDYRRADSDEQREAIFRLRYDAYVREGAVKPSLETRVTDRYDEAANAWTFGLYIDDRLASSFRMHVTSPGFPDLPAVHVFSDVLAPEIASGKTIIDPTRFVADHASARRYPELPYVTVRLGYMAAEFFAADFVLATVRAEHQAFYKRVFGHKPVCPPRPYPALEKPISLMMLHYPPARVQIAQRYPFFRSTLFERRMLFERQTEAARVAA